MHYAIADLGAVVAPGGALDAEVRRRGQTVYLPDGSVPLHPPVLSEDAASLLPDGPRAAVLWTIDLDAAGEPTTVDVRRAVVRSRARLDYAGVQADHDAGRLHPAIAALPELGRLRRELAVRRGAVELELPEQEVVRARRTVAGPCRSGTGSTSRRGTRRSRCSPGWPRRGSCWTPGSGCCARCPRPEPTAVAELRRTARKLGIAWPDGAPAAEVLAGLPLDTPHALALRRAATTLLRGAGYAAFDGAAGSAPPADPGHGGIGAPYAHVTAPLRRLVDRFGTEVCLARDRRPARCRSRCARRCPTLPGADGHLRRGGRQGDPGLRRPHRGGVAGRPGRGASWTRRAAPDGPDGEPGEVYLPEPPVLARCTGPLQAGAPVRARLAEADPATGRIEFAASR